MTFLKTLTKDGWTIYVYALPKERYMIEYSNDGFGSKQRQEYETIDELLYVLRKRFSYKQLKFLDPFMNREHAINLIDDDSSTENYPARNPMIKKNQQ